MTDAAVVVRSHRAAFVGGLWVFVAVILLAAGVMLYLDADRVWLELPLSVPALVIGVVTWRSRVVFRGDGIDITEGWRPRQRILWGVVDRVAVDTDRRFPGVPVWLDLTDGSTVLLPACWGMSRRRRRALVAHVSPVAALHGVEVLAITAPVPASATPPGSHRAA